MSSGYTVLHLITPHRFAGAEKQVALLCDGLINRGHRVFVGGPSRVPLFEAFLEKRQVPFIPMRIQGKINLTAQGQVMRQARRLGADLVHTHLSSASRCGLAAARKLGLPSIGHVHGMNSARWYRDADIVLAGTHGIADHMRAGGIPDEKLRVIYYAIDPDEFAAVPSREEARGNLGIAGDQPVIGVAASLIPRKGHRHLLEAVALLQKRFPDISCLIIGHGPLRDSLEDQAKALNIRSAIHFLGWVSSALDIMAALDVIVLPSTEIEGFGVCLVEAGYLHVPGVASRLPGVSEAVLDEETGFLAEVGDARSLADRIGELLADEKLRRSMGRRAHERTKELFTLERMAAANEALYREMLGD